MRWKDETFVKEVDCVEEDEREYRKCSRLSDGRNTHSGEARFILLRGLLEDMSLKMCGQMSIRCD